VRINQLTSSLLTLKFFIVTNLPQPVRHSFMRGPALLLCLLLAMIFGCDRQEAESTVMPPEVLVAEVIQKDVPIYGEWEPRLHTSSPR